MSFRREAHVPKGGPDGGDGGHGGDVILVADPCVSSLVDYQFKHHFKAARGTHGKGSKMHGARGNDLLLRVPLGTIVRHFDTNTKEAGAPIADLTHVSQQLVVGEGGHGGRGNIHFVTSTRRAPTFAELGEPALDSWIELEMKLMADVALVGMPSAGKSSLIAKMSAAKPKIADYPFTTLVPNIGVARSGDNSFVVADVPGLIEGAHTGKGLGHEFLRHIERSALIVHVVDLTGGFERRDVLSDYAIIKRELELYAPELAKRPTVVVANKIDCEGTSENERLLARQVKKDASAANGGNEFRTSPFDPKLYSISALTGQGVESLKGALATKVFALRKHAQEISDKKPDYERVWHGGQSTAQKKFDVKKLSKGVFSVEGIQVERFVVQTDWENDEAMAFLQHRLKRLGVDKALESAGAINGDEIRIAGRAFEFESTTFEEDIFTELDI
jgi:GTP-binding protein